MKPLLIIFALLLFSPGCVQTNLSSGSLEQNSEYYKAKARKLAPEYVMNDDGKYHGIQMYGKIPESLGDGGSSNIFRLKDSPFDAVWLNTDEKGNIDRMEFSMSFKTPHEKLMAEIDIIKGINQRFGRNDPAHLMADGGALIEMDRDEEEFVNYCASSLEYQDMMKKVGKYVPHHSSNINKYLSSIIIFSRNDKHLAIAYISHEFYDREQEKSRKESEEGKNKAKNVLDAL